MKKVLTVVGIAGMLFMISCKKESVAPPADTPVVAKKLKNSTINFDATISYNADGTPNSITKVTPWHTFTKTYTYQPGKISSVTMIVNGQKEQEMDLILVNGKVTEMVTRNYVNGVLNSTYTDMVAYNAKGLEEKRTFASGNYDVCIYDNNDNLVEFTSYNSQGQATKKSVYTYYAKKDLCQWYGYWNATGNRFFMPAYSRDLLKTQVTTNMLTNQIELDGTLTYEYDNNGYMLKGTWTNNDGSGSPWSWTNSFE